MRNCIRRSKQRFTRRFRGRGACCKGEKEEANIAQNGNWKRKEQAKYMWIHYPAVTVAKRSRIDAIDRLYAVLDAIYASELEF